MTWTCICGEPDEKGIIHRDNRPCYILNNSWRGLTDEEIYDIIDSRESYFQMIKIVIAKLKERNS